MTSKPLKQPKRLYWYTVLAAIALLTCCTIQRKTDVAGLFQHARGVDLSGARVTRHLKSNAQMTTGDGDTESRGPNIRTAAQIAESIKVGMQKKIDKLTVFFDPKSQKAVNRLYRKYGLDKSSIDGNKQKSRFADWMEVVQKAYKGDKDGADVAIGTTLLRFHGDRKVSGIIAAEMVTQTSSDVFYKAFLCIAKVWKQRGMTVEELYESLAHRDVTALLTTPILRTWMMYTAYMGRDPFLFLVSTSKNDYTLANIIATAKPNVLPMTVVQLVPQLLLKQWFEAKKSLKAVFTDLKLNEQGKDVAHSPLWNMWISYLDLLVSATKQREGHWDQKSEAFFVLKQHLKEDLETVIVSAETVKGSVEYARYWSEMLATRDVRPLLHSVSE